MALQREQIDTLLAEIDGVLSKANPRLPWVMSSEVTQQRQTLERIRHYLKGLQSDSGLSALESSGYRPWPESVPTTNLEVASGQFSSGQFSSGQLASGQLASGQLIEAANSPQAALNLSQQMMQAFTQDLVQLRSSLLQPLHSETVRLQQQRDSLLQEIRQLERQRQQHTLIQQRASQEQQVYDFLQGLMDRLQERLSQQINQVVGTLAAQAKMGDGALVLEAQGSALFPQEAGLPPLPPAQRVEQLQMLQARADQVMTTLDTTLRAFAEALQQNIQSYETSLSQGLDKMHSMGQQGEAIVANLVQKLADQVSGQVLSGTLPLPASPGSRLQGLSVQSIPNIPNTSLPATGVQTPQTSAQSAGSGLGASQPFASYASPESSDRATSRFRVPLSKAPKPTVLGNSGPTARTAPKSGATPPTPHSKAVNETVDEKTDGKADLDLDFDLLEQLEQTTVDSPATADSHTSQTIDPGHTLQTLQNRVPRSETPVETPVETPGEPGNEELDAFYASLFGDTPRRVEPLRLNGDLKLEGGTQLGLESGLEAELAADLGLQLDAELEVPDEPELDAPELDAPELDEPELDALVIEVPAPEIEDLAESLSGDEFDRELDQDLEGDPFAELGVGFADDGEALDLDLLDEDEESGSPVAEARRSQVTPEAPPEVTPELNLASAQNPIPNADGGAAVVINPLAGLDLQVPFQGVTELSPQRPAPSAPEDVVTDPLMADLEEALRSLDPSASAPEVTSTLTGSLTGISGLTNEPKPLTPSSREGDSIPPEDIITTLEAILPLEVGASSPPSPIAPSLSPSPPAQDLGPDLGKQPQRPEVSLIPTPPPQSAPPAADPEEEIYHLAPPEEPLLVPDEEEEGAQLVLQVEQETMQQLAEDLLNLKRLPAVDTDDLFNFDRLGDGDGDGFGADPGEDLFGDSFTSSPQAEEAPEEAADLLDELLEESSPPESLLPEAEDDGLDWLLEDAPSAETTLEPTVETTAETVDQPLDQTILETPAETPVVPLKPAQTPAPVSFDLFANSAFEQNLEEDLDLDSSFEEASELSLDRMTDWFGDGEPEPSSAETLLEEPLLIDHLFADLPDAEKKNDDWNGWDL